MNYSELTSLVISKVGYAQPVSGGDNPVSNAEIIEYLNDAFTHMAKKLGGLDKYVEFTITALGAITITVPATVSLQPTISSVSPALGSYPALKISNAYKIKQIENLTSGIKDTAERILYSVNKYQREYQSEFETNTDNYYRWVHENARRGIVLLPKTITETNTIGITYGGKFTRYSVPDFTFSGTGTNNATIGGIYTGTDSVDLLIKIDGTTPDAFRWSLDNGDNWEEIGVLLVAGAYSLGDTGLTVTWGSTILGHILNDTWSSAVIAPDLSYFDEDEQREFPCEYVAAQTLQDLQQNEWYDRMKMADATMSRFLRNREKEVADIYDSIEY